MQRHLVTAVSYTRVRVATGGLPPVDGDQDDQEAAGPDECVADQNINVGQVILDREWS